MSRRRDCCCNGCCNTCNHYGNGCCNSGFSNCGYGNCGYGFGNGFGNNPLLWLLLLNNNQRCF
ncbi:MAG: hypothetical protein ACRC3Y_09845 [Romboutsia sp.]|uniref:hypothetical protein n=1 Tax=Romboutsia sp. TaxID=1965302 RepID=UPI003F3A59F8